MPHHRNTPARAHTHCRFLCSERPNRGGRLTGLFWSVRSRRTGSSTGPRYDSITDTSCVILYIIYIYIIYVHTHTHTTIFIYMHVNIHIYVCIHTYICTYINIQLFRPCYAILFYVITITTVTIIIITVNLIILCYFLFSVFLRYTTHAILCYDI